MRIGDKYLDEAYEKAAIKQKKEELTQEGYIICDKAPFDLLAKKGEHYKAFEFKFRNSKGEADKILHFMEQAEKIGAEPIVVYMSVPGKDSIEFDDLGEIIQDYLIGNFPSELDELSTHTRLSEVYIERISSIRLEENIIIEAEASVCVTLQYGSDRDNEGEEDEYMTFPMEFEAELDWTRQLVGLDYQINTESFLG